MRDSRWPDYLSSVISGHLRHHFRSEASTLWSEADLRFVPWDAYSQQGDAGILIPVDLPPRPVRETWQVPFGSTTLRLWSRVPRPPGWRSWPSDGVPLWHLDGAARAMPAWDLSGNLRRLLSLEEEAAPSPRDRHDRFPHEASPRWAAGLLDVPALNESVAALLALLAARRRGAIDPDPDVEEWLLPPAVILSHDLDLLRGDDGITQSIRVWRTVRPLLHGRPPAPRYLRAIGENRRRPHRGYLDALGRIVELEREAGARSVCYFLNGIGGRFGARSGSQDIPQARALLPEGWSVGMHYNHDTLHDEGRFAAQRTELESLLGERVEGGRAHYLRFRGPETFAFWEERGMRWDESLGYSRAIGYRAGIAGAYHPPDGDWRPRRILALPLAFMDAAVAGTSLPARRARVLDLLRHLRAVGGTLTMLFHLEEVGHPDLDGDEKPYAELLSDLRAAGVRFRVPRDYLDEETTGGSSA